MNEKHFQIICEQLEMTIEKLLLEGFSEISVLKALTSTLWDFTEGFEEIDDYESLEE